MALKNINSSSVKIFNPFGLYVTPFSSANVKGTDTYFLGEVIRDTTTISQEDPTENKIENEFGTAPILNNTQLGSYTFSAEVADMQPELLNILCGYQTSTDGKKSYAPSTYAPVYAEIALVFKVGTYQYVAAVLPKVQLNSKATFDSLSSSMGRITLAGTGLNIAVDSVETPFYVDANYVREGQIGLSVSGVTATSFTVTAAAKGVTPTAYEWKENGSSVSSETDSEYGATSKTSKTTYTILCRGKISDTAYTDWAEVVVTTL